MIPSEYGSTAPTSAKSSLRRCEIDEPAARVHLGPLERAREELQLRELDGLVHGLEHLVPVRAGLDQVRGEPERLRARVRVLEAARVGDERDVQRLRDLGRELDAELREDVREDLARRGRVGDDEVDVAEAGVVVVVVDVERERRLGEQRRVRPEPLLLRAVDGDEHALGVVGRRLAVDAVELEERVLARERRLPGDEHRALLAELAQREVHREQGAERVAVRVLVRRDEEALVLAERGHDRLHVIRLRHRCSRARAGGFLGRELVDQLVRAARPARPWDRIRT